MKVGTLYLVNSKWQGYNPWPKKISTSQANHPADMVVSPVHSIKATVTGKHQDISDGSSRTVSDSNCPPQHTHHIPAAHIFPPTHNLLLFLWAPEPSLNLQQFLTTQSHSRQLHSPSVSFLTQPKHSPLHFLLCNNTLPHSTWSHPPLHPRGPNSQHRLSQPQQQFKTPSFYLLRFQGL